MTQESLKRKVLITAKISEGRDMEEIVYLIKDDDIDEYYLIETINGWRQISEIQKAWDILIKYKYYVKKDVVPLIYYILATNPKQINDIFEFLYQNNFIMTEEDEQE